jgi:hypothetical protein
LYDQVVAKELSSDSIEAGTGRPWSEWLIYFTGQGGESLSHQELVEVASAAGAPSWWRQMVAVKYEQHIGRRVTGQGSDGSFNVSVSKTWSGTLDAALERWRSVMDQRTEFSGIAISKGPDVTKTEKWRYWRTTLADGSRVVVNISAKTSEKSVISVQHENLLTDEAVEHWRIFWKSILKEI